MGDKDYDATTELLEKLPLESTEGCSLTEPSDTSSVLSSSVCRSTASRLIKSICVPYYVTAAGLFILILILFGSCIANNQHLKERIAVLEKTCTPHGAGNGNNNEAVDNEAAKIVSELENLAGRIDMLKVTVEDMDDQFQDYITTSEEMLTNLSNAHEQLETDTKRELSIINSSLHQESHSLREELLAVTIEAQDMMNRSTAEVFEHVESKIAEVSGHIDTVAADLRTRVDNKVSELGLQINSTISAVREYVNSQDSDIRGEIDARTLAAHDYVDTKATEITRHINSTISEVKEYANSHDSDIRGEINTQVSAARDETTRYIDSTMSGMREYVNSQNSDIRGEIHTQVSAERDYIDTKANKITRHIDSEAARTRRHADSLNTETRGHIDAKTSEVRTHADSEIDRLRYDMYNRFSELTSSAVTPQSNGITFILLSVACTFIIFM
jgi:ElaB/YqjD/DUF883 family membrane-anchored ribosome-binding protein